MNQFEIITNSVREAVNTMSSKVFTLMKGKLDEKADVSSVPAKVSDLTNDSGYQTAQQVEDKIDAKISSAYKAGGSATMATLPALTAAKLGVVVNMSEDFTTTADFLEGAGKTYSAGTNVVVASAGENAYKYDVLAGFVDLSDYVEDTRKIGNVPLSADIPVALTGDSAITVTNTGTASAIGYSVVHKDSGVTAGSKGDTTNQTPGFGGTFKALSATVDAKGHVTALGDHTVEIPDDPATAQTDGLMSKTDKAKLDGIETQANKTIIDATLSHDGQAADAKTTGDTFSALQSLILRMEIHCTASGNPATFADADAAGIKDLRVKITPTQSGSGDPSPTNIRPISGVSSVSVTRTGENGTNPQTVAVQLTDGSNSLTVYGGTLNVTTGTLSVTHTRARLVDPSSYGEHGAYFNNVLDRAALRLPGLCSHGVCATANPWNDAPASYLWLGVNNTAIYWVGVLDVLGLSSMAELNAWLNENTVEVVYELATPLTYQVTPQQLATLHGYNAVSSDAGSVDVAYKADNALIPLGGNV